MNPIQIAPPKLAPTSPGPRAIKVSDHAVVRYLERFYEFDADLWRAEILAMLEAAQRLGVDGVFPLGDTGLSAVIRDATVVTIQLSDARLR